jgi:hypothetical protein
MNRAQLLVGRSAGRMRVLVGWLLRAAEGGGEHDGQDGGGRKAGGHTHLGWRVA